METTLFITCLNTEIPKMFGFHHIPIILPKSKIIYLLQFYGCPYKTGWEDPYEQAKATEIYAQIY